ncbi:MAG: aminopeptidase P family protein [Phycisphaerales bacterium]|nr:aminopeptidase P family protein [Phycisphaerales bacterium]
MAKKPAKVPEKYARRLTALRSAMRERDLGAYVVLDRKDQYYLTGFTGEDGAVLITSSRVTLLTDGRFDETADIETPWAKKVVRKQRGADSYVKAIAATRVKVVGFDPNHMNVLTFSELKKRLKPIDLKAASGLVTELRLRKDASEIAAIRKAIKVAEDAFVATRRYIRAGATEAEVAARLVFEMTSRGASGPAFGPIVAAGANSSLPHYEPRNVKIRNNSIVLIDWGARVDWHISDLTRVVAIGSIPRKMERVYQVVREAHDRAVAAARPGIAAGELDAVARDHIRSAGFGDRFSHSLGHGIGLDVHEGPGLRVGATVKLEPGMVVTIEPGVYLPGVGGVRLENDVLITREGAESLSSLPL